MNNQEVMVVYKWTAKTGKAAELKAIYDDVMHQMQTKEPDAKQVECYFEDASSTLVVMDIFADPSAVGFHLGTTAAGHFDHLLKIATPGEFLFCGEMCLRGTSRTKSGLFALFSSYVDNSMHLLSYWLFSPSCAS